MDDDLREWLAGELGETPTAWTDCSQDHRQTAVWRVECGGRRVYVKRHRHHRKFVQERHAYANWLRPSDPVPRVVAESEPLRSLVLSEVPGTVAEGRSETPDLYRQAGCFLRGLHDRPLEDGDPVPPAEAFVQSGIAYVERAAGLLPDEDRRRAAVRIGEAADVLRGMKRRPCHRDFTARNWLSDGERLSVIDFEHARPDLWLVDVERVRSATDDDRLFAAFLDGYGRTLTGHDREALSLVTLHSGLSRLVWAVRHRDAAFEAKARRTLAACLA